jgi:MFS transporter, PAT family, beta-lactamase induction signal transducer AmpG
MGVGLVTCLVAPRVDPPDTRGPGFAAFLRSLSEPVEDVIRRADRRLVLALMLVALFRVPDFAAGVMAGPLYIDSGYTKIEIANVTKIYGIWISIAGAIVGGLAITRFGIKRPLLVGALAAAFSNLMFSWLAASTRDLGLLTLTISVDNFAGGFAGTTLIAYMSAMAGRRYAATQYALLSSLYALPGKFLGGVSGFAVNAFGYPVFFALTAAVGLPLAILCLIVGTPPKAPEDETVPAEPAHQT